MTPTYDARPAIIDWVFFAGDTVKLTLTFFVDLECTTHLDVSGLTFDAKMVNRQEESTDGTVSVSGVSTVTVSFPGGPAGYYKYSIAAITTVTQERQTLAAGAIEITKVEGWCDCGC